MNNTNEQKLLEFLLTINSKRKVLHLQQKFQPKISLIKQDIANLMVSIEKLKFESTKLNENIQNMSENEWTRNMQEIKEIQFSILQKIQLYESPDYLTKIQQLLKKRQNKRQRIKRMKQTQQFNKHTFEKKHRQILNTKIDKWQRDQLLLNEDKKSLSTIKVQHILDTILKQKIEAKHFISMVDGLIELRRMRKIQYGEDDRGEKHFFNEMTKLKSLWLEALSKYNKNELELREKSSNEIPFWIEQEWMQLFFGTNEKPNGSFNGHSYNLNEFIRIRQMWDSFLVPSEHPIGSSIPLGWVLPPDNRTEVSANWRVYGDNLN